MFNKLLLAIWRVYLRASSSLKDVGGVNSISLFQVYGWHIPKNKSRGADFYIEYRGIRYDVIVERVFRESKAIAYKRFDVDHGFFFNIPKEVSFSIFHDPASIIELNVFCDGKKIAIDKDTELKFGVDEGYKLSRLDFRREVFSGPVLLGMDFFSIFGSSNEELVSDDVFEIKIGGQIIIPKVFKNFESITYPVPFDLDEPNFFFEIEVPGYIWESVSNSQTLSFQIYLNGNEVGEKIEVSNGQVEAWINNICLGLGDIDTYSLLLMLEHLRFINRRLNLPDRSVNYLADKISWYKFSDYINLYSLLVESEKGGEFEKAVYNNVDRAVKAISADFVSIKSERGIRDKIEELIFGYELTEEDLLVFYSDLLPYCCGKFGSDIVIDSLTNSHVESLNRDDNEYFLSQALVVNIYLGDFDNSLRVIKLFKDTSVFIRGECIFSALKLILSGARGFSRKNSEALLHGLVTVLTCRSKEYWSASQNRYLKLFYVELLSVIDSFAKDLAELITSSALSAYGLSSEFWVLLGEKGVVISLNEKLERASNDFSVIRELLTKTDISVEGFDVLATKLIAVSDFQNTDLDMCARSLLLNLSDEQINRYSQNAQRSIQSYLFSRYPEEMLRLKAFPLNQYETVDFNEQSLYEIIRTQSRIATKSSYYDEQKRAYALLLALYNKNDDSYKTEILSISLLLITKSQRYLGLDILTRAHQILWKNHLDNSLEELLFSESERIIEALGCSYTEFPALTNIVSLLRCGDLKVEVLTRWPVLERLRGASKQHSILSDNQSSAPLGDTLVVLYSCNKYLPERLPAIRAAWLNKLEERNIPYVILVGDGDDSLDANILRLDVADSYEALPLKSVKMVDWIYKNTDYNYLIKIDDDCFLDVDEFFSTLSYRKHNYYGRILRRDNGGDRGWHFSKSSGQNSRYSFDKSLEPSIYTDGGCGYALSRAAMKLIVDYASTSAGQKLIGSSYFEDKLVGDMLASRKVYPSDEDFYTHVLRRTAAEALPVSMYENTFHCSSAVPTKITHLDATDTLSTEKLLQEGDKLYPKKIWPTYASPTLKFNGNQLELLSDETVLKKLQKETFSVVCMVFNEISILKHFLEYYRSLGIKCFIFVDNLSTDGTREYLLQQSDVILYSTDTEFKASHYGVDWQQAILTAHCLNKWVLLADADEFIVYPECEDKPIQEYVAAVEQKGFDAVSLYMVDMYPKGSLAAANLDQQNPFECCPYFDKEPLIPRGCASGVFSNDRRVVGSQLRHRLIEGSKASEYTAQKYALLKFRPWMHLSEGLHDVSDIVPDEQHLAFAHFKYHAAFQEKVRLEVSRGQHYDNAKEYKKYQLLLKEQAGDFYSDSLSEKYRGSVAFIEHLSKLKNLGESDEAPVIIWTFRRTGGTNVAQAVFDASVFTGVEHEPFNMDRLYGYVHENWKKNRDIVELRFLLDKILSQKVCLKHCLEIVPDELNMALIEISSRYGYKHVFLYREEARDRLLSLNFAMKTGVWGRLNKEDSFDDSVFNEDIEIDKLIGHENNSRRSMLNVYQGIVNKGLPFFVISFESLYRGEDESSKLLLSNLFEFLVADEYYLSDDFLRKILTRGAQGTKEHYLCFRNSAEFIDKLDKLNRFKLTS